MRELFIPLAILPTIAVTTPGEAQTWWQHAQQNGVGFVFFVLFTMLLALSAKRQRDAETLANKERLDMQKEIRDLNQAQLTQQVVHAEAQLAQQTGHATRLEQLIKDQTKSASDHAMELRNLTRKMNRPCVAPLHNNESDA